ncbi:protein SRG1-like [Pistacia vera]|uniref:protein SRG1-like n=1 Tax=Pistacia vera TaxID=55513 RepID=UPI001263ABDE|nr:protein SRG1-like [Pistacia vera]
MGSNSDETIIENEDAPTYAPSIPVPNVQEMVRKEPAKIPDRYIRNDEDNPPITDMSHLSSEIPVINLSLLSTGETEELNKLDFACKEWGFFQVVNHRIAKEVLQNMKDATAEFFELPLEEKNKYEMPPDDIQGYGHAYVVSEEQKLDWSDALILLVHPSHYRKLKLWPSTPKGYREIINAYTKGVQKVGEQLLRAFSTIMGMDKDGLLALHKNLLQALRINYYPACCRPDQVLGISPHSDTSSITILMQEADINGLQIRHNGGWVQVKPVPDALVVNVGDVIEILSNGKYKSIEHRAVTNQNNSRISYASFLIPQDDVEIEPLAHLVGSQRLMYKQVVYGEYARSSMQRKMEGKAHTEIAKIET